MTLPYPHDSVCAVCGAESEQTDLMSSSSFGAPDLDSRPPALLRDTIDWWVHECPVCGYCAADIAKAPPEAERVVHSEAYRRQLKDSDTPDLARRFLCQAMVLEATGGRPTDEVVSALLAAAWACDDAGATEAAAQLRLRTAATLEAAREAGGLRDAEDPSAPFILLADLYRRAGRFEEAGAAARAGLDVVASDFHRALLEFQVRLVGARDDSVHTCDEAS